MDGDGDLDLIVVNRNGPNGLYINALSDGGRATFANVARAAGVEDAAGDAAGAAWGDFDGDGLPDLYVVNGAADSVLYLNRGDGLFEVRARAPKYHDCYRYSNCAPTAATTTANTLLLILLILLMLMMH